MFCFRNVSAAWILAGDYKAEHLLPENYTGYIREEKKKNRENYNQSRLLALLKKNYCSLTQIRKRSCLFPGFRSVIPSATVNVLYFVCPYFVFLLTPSALKQMLILY